MTRLTVPLLLALVLYAPSIQSAPKWLLVGTYKANNGATAATFIDGNSIVRTGKLIRVWVMTDYTEFQEGDWIAPRGESRAYMSDRHLVVIDCRTKDIGHGTWTALDGPKGAGSIVHTIEKPVPVTADYPAAPGTVGEALVLQACRVAK